MGIASLAGLVVDKAQYVALAAHCRHDSAFPDWLAWNKMQIRAASIFLRHNKTVDMWRLDLNDFCRWCTEAQLAPSVEALERYADATRGEPASFAGSFAG